MSVEQVARDFVMMMADSEKALGMVTADAVASGGVLPQPIPMKETVTILSGLKTAMPDLKFEVQQVMVNGDQATVKAMPTIPPTGKNVSVKDTYIVTVKGDKVSHFQVDSPADGGIPAALMQMGVQMPGM